ncbi:hypothetical protein P4I53_22090, partial [Escherichia coli]
EWVHVQLHQQKGMISLSPPTICNSAARRFSGRICAANLSSFSVTTMAALLPGVLIMWNCK